LSYVYTGSGQTLGGGSSSSSTSKGGAAPSSEAELRVRRENVRLAALKRIENQSKE
jgi:hypothetical protein